jgi:hypothetical protein
VGPFLRELCPEDDDDPHAIANRLMTNEPLATRSRNGCEGLHRAVARETLTYLRHGRLRQPREEPEMFDPDLIFVAFAMIVIFFGLATIVWLAMPPKGDAIQESQHANPR